MMRSAEIAVAATRRTLFLAALMLAVAASTATLKPVPRHAEPAPDLEALLPDAFGAWRRIPVADAVLPAEIDLKPGEAMAFRAYKDAAGRIVTLVAAYGPPLGDSVRLHRPESCYVAQGYEIRSRRAARETLAGAEAVIVRLKTASPSREEAVSYWLRSGAEFIDSAPAAQLQILKGGDAARDGALVRVSSRGKDPLLFDIQTAFLKEFAGALEAEGRRVLLGFESAPQAAP